MLTPIVKTSPCVFSWSKAPGEGDKEQGYNHQFGLWEMKLLSPLFPTGVSVGEGGSGYNKMTAALWDRSAKNDI